MTDRLTEALRTVDAFTEAWEASSDIETPDGRTIRISGGDLRYGVDLPIGSLRALADEARELLTKLHTPA